jgi:hypothetical protein
MITAQTIPSVANLEVPDAGLATTSSAPEASAARRPCACGAEAAKRSGRAAASSHVHRRRSSPLARAGLVAAGHTRRIP